MQNLVTKKVILHFGPVSLISEVKSHFKIFHINLDWYETLPTVYYCLKNTVIVDGTIPFVSNDKF